MTHDQTTNRTEPEGTVHTDVPACCAPGRAAFIDTAESAPRP